MQAIDIHSVEDVMIGDQAEAVCANSLYRYSQWDMVMRQFKRCEVIEDVSCSLAYSPLYQQSFQLKVEKTGELQFYRRRSHAIV